MHYRLVAVSALAGLLFGASVGCGGSSSETPPPLEPTPANVHYDRSATTLPGELGSTTPEPEPKSEKQAAPPEPGRDRAEP